MTAPTIIKLALRAGAAYGEVPPEISSTEV